MLTLSPIELRYLLLERIAAMRHIRENQGENRSPEIDKMCKALKVPLGSNWCAVIIQYHIMLIEEEFNIKSHIYKSVFCPDIWNKSPQLIKHQIPEVGDIALWFNRIGWGGHIGIVAELPEGDRMITLEGNTTPPAGSKDTLEGVYYKRRLKTEGNVLALQGFLRPFEPLITNNYDSTICTTAC